MEYCVIRKCTYAAVWTRNVRAFDADGHVVVSLNRQKFCFFHYVDLTLGKLRVKQLSTTRGSFGDLILREKQ